MTVSMIQLLIELPGVMSKKDKRSIVNSFKQKLHQKFKVSAAEIDLQESLKYTQIGAALVSNSKEHGEKVMQKILLFAEDEVPGRVHDVEIYTEHF